MGRIRYARRTSMSARPSGILTGFVTASALLGLLFAPSNAGKSLEEIQEERADDEPRFTREDTPARERIASG